MDSVEKNLSNGKWKKKDWRVWSGVMWRRLMKKVIKLQFLEWLSN
jgi:hypothetical protein